MWITYTPTEQERRTQERFAELMAMVERLAEQRSGLVRVD